MLRNLSSRSFRGFSNNCPTKFINSPIHTDPNITEQFQTQNSIVLYRCTTTSCPYLLTYLLTPWCRVLLEKLTGLQLVKKFPAFHRTRRFITTLTSVRHLSLSWASPIQSIYPHPTSWRSILMLSTHLRLGLPSGLLSSSFPSKTLYNPVSSPLLLCIKLLLIYR